MAFCWYFCGGDRHIEAVAAGRGGRARLDPVCFAPTLAANREFDGFLILAFISIGYKVLFLMCGLSFVNLRGSRLRLLVWVANLMRGSISRSVFRLQAIRAPSSRGALPRRSWRHWRGLPITLAINHIDGDNSLAGRKKRIKAYRGLSLVDAIKAYLPVLAGANTASTAARGMAVPGPVKLRAAFLCAFLWLAWATGLGVWAWSETGLQWPLALAMGLALTLSALAVIDWRTGLLPNQLTFPLIIIGLIVGIWIAPHLWPHHLIGALAGYLFIEGLDWAYTRARGRSGIGGGDAKLLAAGGAWLTWAGLPSVMLIAALIGLLQALVSGKLGKGRALAAEIRFGPALAAAIWIVWLYGPLEFGI